MHVAPWILVVTQWSINTVKKLYVCLDINQSIFSPLNITHTKIRSLTLQLETDHYQRLFKFSYTITTENRLQMKAVSCSCHNFITTSHFLGFLKVSGTLQLRSHANFIFTKIQLSIFMTLIFSQNVFWPHKKVTNFYNGS